MGDCLVCPLYPLYLLFSFVALTVKGHGGESNSGSGQPALSYMPECRINGTEVQQQFQNHVTLNEVLGDGRCFLACALDEVSASFIWRSFNGDMFSLSRKVTPFGQLR